MKFFNVETQTQYLQSLKNFFVLALTSYLLLMLMSNEARNLLGGSTQALLVLYLLFSLSFVWLGYKRAMLLIIRSNKTSRLSFGWLSFIVYFFPIAYLYYLFNLSYQKDYESFSFTLVVRKGFLSQLVCLLVALLFIVNKKSQHPVVQFSFSPASFYALNTGAEAFQVFSFKKRWEDDNGFCQEEGERCLIEWSKKQTVITSTAPILMSATDALMIYKRKPKSPSFDELAITASQLLDSSSTYVHQMCRLERPLSWLKENPFGIVLYSLETALLNSVDNFIIDRAHEVVNKNLLKISESFNENKDKLKNTETIRKIASLDQRIRNIQCH